jgi:hypothetical protein
MLEFLPNPIEILDYKEQYKQRQVIKKPKKVYTGIRKIKKEIFK